MAKKTDKTKLEEQKAGKDALILKQKGIVADLYMANDKIAAEKALILRNLQKEVNRLQEMQG